MSRVSCRDDSFKFNVPATVGLSLYISLDSDIDSERLILFVHFCQSFVYITLFNLCVSAGKYRSNLHEYPKV